MAVTIQKVNADFEREPLLRPFGFKGGYHTELWQTAVRLESTGGAHAVGLGTQNVLWSDAAVCASHSEAGGHALMYAMTEHALRLLPGVSFDTPLSLLDALLDEVYDYGTRVCGVPALRKTFALNALVSVDNAAWLLYAREHGIETFEGMIPESFRPALAHRHQSLASIPLMAYAVPIQEIEQAAADGYFFMKIKLGQPGTQEEMLAKDKERIRSIHETIGHLETAHSRNGKLPYYFDANGRYESKDALRSLIGFLESIGALDQVALIEEPFPEDYEADVGDLGVRIAADESAHTDADALRRIQMGYQAIALKPIAKTLSMTLRIAQLAREHQVPCFCADLTVNPTLVDWNKNIAARLPPFPGLDVGLLETNGHQNYRNWERMRSYHPHGSAAWTQSSDGLFRLGEDFYRQSGGIFAESDHYRELFAPAFS